MPAYVSGADAGAYFLHGPLATAAHCGSAEVGNARVAEENTALFCLPAFEEPEPAHFPPEP